MCNSGDMFKDKLDGHLGEINGVKKYIDNIMVLWKKNFTKHT